MVFVPVAGSIKKRVSVSLDRRGKERKMVVVFAGRGHDRIDLDLSSIHKAPETKGGIVVRGVLRDCASARVRGLIRIEKNAKKSEDSMEGRVLLIGDKAKVDISPYLEIKNDDVKASHAVTVGVPDQEQLFYLRSRGLSEEQAVGLLVDGFLGQSVAGQQDKRVGLECGRVKKYALG